MVQIYPFAKLGYGVKIGQAMNAYLKRWRGRQLA